MLLEQLLHRMPNLANAEIRQMINGPESFTPDSKYLLGEVPEVLIRIHQQYLAFTTLFPPFYFATLYVAR